MIKAISVALLIAALQLAPARADQNSPALDVLFERLLETGDAVEAEALTGDIWRLWLHSDDDQVNELMVVGTSLMNTGRAEAALDIFDRMVAIAPAFAEGWNKRATVHWMLGNFQESVDDIERTLALEPRHFGALSGLGLIYMEVGRDEVALRAFEGALAINPHLHGPRQNIEVLKDRLDEKAI